MTTQTMGSKSKELAAGLFGGSKLADAKMRIDSNWEKEGHYLQRIDLIKLDQNRSGDTALFIEKTIVHVIDDADGDGHRLGESVTHSMWAKHDSFMGNVKGFLAHVLGISPAEVTEATVGLIIDDKQPLSGTIVEVKNRVIQTKKNTDFTIINYKREVPPAEALEALSDEVKALYFPDGILERMAEIEAAQA